MSCILNIENENELTAAKLKLIAFREEEGYRNLRQVKNVTFGSEALIL
jgi:hypothetical protein